MSWSATCLSVVLASSPPQRLNVEPIGFGVAGLLVMGVGAWRLAVAQQRFEELTAVPSKASSAEEAARLLATARALVVTGELETTAGTALLFVGGAVAVASALWFFIEGPTTRDWWLAVGPQGVSMGTKF